MLTPEDISNVEFTKTLGGYKTSEVDDFLDQCSDTVTALLNERASLTKKLEVLADKVVECRDKLDAYQRDEDNIRAALIGAQRMGDSVVREAQQKADLILKDAEIKAEKIKDSAQSSIVGEQEELKRIQREVAGFKNRMLTLYKEHLTLIHALPEPESEAVPAAPPAPAVTPVPLVPPQRDVPATPAEPEPEIPAPSIDLPPQTPAEPVPVAVPETPVMKENTVMAAVSAADRPSAPAPVTESASASVPVAESVSATAQSRFADLQFGEEYDIFHREDKRGFFKKKK